MTHMIASQSHLRVHFTICIPLSRSSETGQLPRQLADHRFGETKIILHNASWISTNPGQKVNFRVKLGVEYQEQSQRLVPNLFNIVTKSLGTPFVGRKERKLHIGPNEAFRCAVFQIDKHNVLWIAAWRVDREEDDRVLQDLRLRMHRSAFEKEQLFGAELGTGAFVSHPECASA